MSVVNESNVPSYIFRDFINKRLSAVAEEIFSVFERTVDKYEKELDRQRRLLDASGKPGTSELPQASVKDEVPLKQQHWEPNKRTSVDHSEIQHSLIKNEEHKDIQIKEEQEESCSSQEMFSPFEKNIHHQHQRVNDSCQQKSMLEKKELRQQLFYDKSDVSTAQKHHSHKNNPDNAEPRQTKEEQEDPWPTQDVERPSLTQETDVFMVTVPNGASDENQCQVMSAQFISASTEAIVAGPVRKRVKCDLCGNSFRNKSKLGVHMRIHTGEKPYPCETCGKHFRRSHALKAHRRIHTGEKPYDCKVCGRYYRTRGHVTEHMRMHTGEKPYHCGTCDKRFSRLSNLTIHRLIHTGVRYSCTTCGKSYSQQATLRRHWKLHSLEEIVIP